MLKLSQMWWFFKTGKKFTEVKFVNDKLSVNLIVWMQCMMLLVFFSCCHSLISEISRAWLIRYQINVGLNFDMLKRRRTNTSIRMCVWWNIIEQTNNILNHFYLRFSRIQNNIFLCRIQGDESNSNGIDDAARKRKHTKQTSFEILVNLSLIKPDTNESFLQSSSLHSLRRNV